MSAELVKKIMLLRHFQRQDLEDEIGFKSEFSSIDDINIKKIYKINTKLYDDLLKFNDLMPIYKNSDEKTLYCERESKVCDDFDKYELLATNVINRIKNTINYIYVNSVTPNIFVVTHADSVKQFNDGIGMTYYKKYDITDKIRTMEGGSKYKSKEKTYIDKINKYTKRLNNLKDVL